MSGTEDIELAPVGATSCPDSGSVKLSDETLRGIDALAEDMPLTGATFSQRISKGITPFFEPPLRIPPAAVALHERRRGRREEIQQ